VSREFKTHSPEETVAAGRMISNFLEPGQLWILRGDLGAGKTTLVKGIAEGFEAALQEEVTSPTFTLAHEYRGLRLTIFHLDFYRIDTDRELMTLGIDDLRAEPASIVLAEWGEKFESIMKQSDGEIAIDRLSDTDRKITVTIRPRQRRMQLKPACKTMRSG
jgi:tRNA threonylcarbamoyladenosine biosynthesis protein TsaE